MLFFVTELPNPELSDKVKTLVTVQVRKQELGEITMKPFIIRPETKSDWAAVTESFLPKRMSCFFAHWHCDPILPGEIKIRHFRGRSRKIFYNKLKDLNLINENTFINQFYFSFNKNCHTYITNMGCSQHIDITIKLEEKTLEEKLDLSNRKRKRSDRDDDILVIKLEPDF